MTEDKGKIGERIKRMGVQDYALYLLSLSMQTADKLREKMLRKGYDSEEITTVITRLTELGYLNDAQFAQIYFENLKKYKYFGYYGIKRKLIDKKVSSKVIDLLLKGFTSKDEQGIASHFLQGKKNKTAEQLSRALQSRGFRLETIFKVIKAQNRAEE